MTSDRAAYLKAWIAKKIAADPDWKKKQKAKHSEAQKKWRDNNPERVKEIKRKSNERRIRDGRLKLPWHHHRLWWKRPLNPKWPVVFADIMRRRTDITIAKIADSMGIHAGMLSRFICGNAFYVTDRWKTRLQIAMGTFGEYLDVSACWPTEEEIVIPRDIPQPVKHLRELDLLKIEELIDQLKPMEQIVLRMRFWEGHTLQSAGNQFGVSRERIRQIEAVALRNLRHPSRLRIFRDLRAEFSR